MTYWKAPDVTDPIPSLAPDSGSLAALVASSTAARAVALLHEDYHADRVCFVTDPAECPGHQDAHDITQVLVNAGLLAWSEADVPTQGESRG